MEFFDEDDNRFVHCPYFRTHDCCSSLVILKIFVSLSTSVSDPVPDWGRITAWSVDQDPVSDFRILIQARKNELQKKKKVKKLHVSMCCTVPYAGFQIRID
jgi:hypothetical protein